MRGSEGKKSETTPLLTFTGQQWLLTTNYRLKKTFLTLGVRSPPVVILLNRIWA